MDQLIPYGWSLVTLVIGLVAGAWWAEWRKRPVLKVNGGGAGQTQTYKQSHWTLTNEVGFIGVRVGGTTVLGKRLHSGVRRGIPVLRNPATKCYAHLYDRDTKRLIAPLYWRADDGTFVQSATIVGGDTRDLMIFAGVPSEPTKYFPFAPDPTSPQTPLIPPEQARLEGPMRLEVRVTSSTGTLLQESFDVVKDYGGNLHEERRRGNESRSL